MSTSLLYHGFGVRGYQHLSTRFEGGRVIFTIRQNLSGLSCTCCGASQVRTKGEVIRQFRSLPIGLKPVLVSLCYQTPLLPGLRDGATSQNRFCRRPAHLHQGL